MRKYWPVSRSEFWKIEKTELVSLTSEFWRLFSSSTASFSGSSETVSFAGVEFSEDPEPVVTLPPNFCNN